jgi:hypothetical protein
MPFKLRSLRNSITGSFRKIKYKKSYDEISDISLTGIKILQSSIGKLEPNKRLIRQLVPLLNIFYK